ncbi:MAG: DUF3179 domain-containing protein [Chromatiaceae bacterium]|nr:MAG: DUF3179 domain-containing protein [Chromatiaceae bacterium]
MVRPLGRLQLATHRRGGAEPLTPVSWRRLGGQPLSFGVSGLLYNSNLLLYDRETESLWSQLSWQAISGPMAGTRLRPVPVVQTRWEGRRSAATRHPRRVLAISGGDPPVALGWSDRSRQAARDRCNGCRAFGAHCPQRAGSEDAMPADPAGIAV